MCESCDFRVAHRQTRDGRTCTVVQVKFKNLGVSHEVS